MREAKSTKPNRNYFFIHFFPPEKVKKEIFPNVLTEILIKLDQTLLSDWKEENQLQSSGETVGFQEAGVTGSNEDTILCISPYN